MVIIYGLLLILAGSAIWVTTIYRERSNFILSAGVLIGTCAVLIGIGFCLVPFLDAYCAAHICAR